MLRSTSIPRLQISDRWATSRERHSLFRFGAFIAARVVAHRPMSGYRPPDMRFDIVNPFMESKRECDFLSAAMIIRNLWCGGNTCRWPATALEILFQLFGRLVPRMGRATRGHAELCAARHLPA
jgi:hypothetical protein